MAGLLQTEGTLSPLSFHTRPPEGLNEKHFPPLACGKGDNAANTTADDGGERPTRWYGPPSASLGAARGTGEHPPLPPAGCGGPSLLWLPRAVEGDAAVVDEDDAAYSAGSNAPYLPKGPPRPPESLPASEAVIERCDDPRSAADTALPIGSFDKSE